MSGRVGSITTDIAAKGLVFNLDAANRASFLPVVSNTQGFNTVNPSQTITSATSDIFNTSNNVKNFSFGGVDDYMTLSSGLTVSSFTVDLWLKTNHVNDEGSQNAYVDNLTGGTGFFQFFSFGQLGSNNMRLSNYHSAPTNDFALSTDELNDNLWHNCIITFENGTLKSYIDGLSDKTVTGLSNWSTSTLNTIGRYYQSDIRYYTGTLASLRIYNQVLPVREREKNFDGLKRRVGYVAPLTVSFLVVAGGGAGTGGAQQGIGGPGAGGLRTSFGSTSGGGASAEDTLTLLPGTSYTVTIGAGGASSSNVNNANKGNDSVFSTITSEGGGKGGDGNNVANGGNGGSGGGGGRSRSGGSGTAGQGFDGGDPVHSGANYIGGGGGGASEAGKNGSAGGGGGDGLAVAITGTSVTYAGGGGAGVYSPTSQTPPPGGAGGGGTGGVRNGDAPTAGGVNTGGGGGAARGDGSESSAAGGSGVVILRYPSSNSITVGAGLTSSTSTDGSFKVTTFTAGTDTISFS